MLRVRRLIPLLLGLLFLIAAPRPARAEFQLGLEGLTDFPLHVGAKVWAELPLLRLRLGVSAGIMPGAYVDLVNAAATGAGLYDDQTGALLRTSLENALVVRVRAGVRPLSERNLYVDIGYGLVALGGGKSSEAALAAVQGKQSSTQSGQYDVKGQLQMLDVEVGWYWRLFLGITLRVGVGFAFTFSSKQSITPAFQPQDPQMSQMIAQGAEKKLDENSKLFTPTATLAIGWQFF